MKEEYTNVSFDRTTASLVDFDIFPLETILSRSIENPDPRKTHRVTFYVMIIAKSGHGKHTIDFEDYEFGKGSIVTVRKNQIHRFHEGNAKGFLIAFTEEFVLSHLDKSGSQKIGELFNELLFSQHTRLSKDDQKSMDVILNQIQLELTNPFDDHKSGIIRNLLQVIIRKLHRIRSTSPKFTLTHKYTPKFLELQNLIERHCDQHRSVSYYAEKMNTTTKTINNITQKVGNQTAKEFIDSLSVLNIKRILLNTNLSVKEVAIASGFEDTTNFFKYFKRHTDQTPESFRSIHAH